MSIGCIQQTKRKRKLYQTSATEDLFPVAIVAAMIVAVAVVALPESEAVMCYVAGSGYSVAGSGGGDVLRYR